MSQAINYTALKGNYQTLWDTMVIRPEKLVKAKQIASVINSYKHKYEEVNVAVKKVAAASQIPWYFIALVHKRECVKPYEFKHHLHNGDPLTARTVQVPKGRPVKGTPPFSFIESAADALIYQGLTAEMDWSIPKMLYRLEAYNGFGYQQYHNMNSPYLWAGSNHYTKGKYVEDNKFNPNVVDAQIGTALVLKQLL